MSQGAATGLDAGGVAGVDASSQLADVTALPEQLRDALWKIESARIQPFDAPGGLIVAGMGGSGIGGALARAALGDRMSRPIGLARCYELPAWATPDTAVLCSSYSGDTEETLACYEAAGALGAPRIVATTGGRLAELARQDGVPIIPVAGGYQPRGRRRLHDGRRARGGVAVRRRAERALGGRRRGRPRRGAGGGVGPRRRRRLPGQGRWRRPCTRRSP